jgi:hypothetical protein
MDVHVGYDQVDEVDCPKPLKEFDHNLTEASSDDGVIKVSALVILLFDVVNCGSIRQEYTCSQNEGQG